MGTTNREAKTPRISGAQVTLRSLNFPSVQDDTNKAQRQGDLELVKCKWLGSLLNDNSQLDFQSRFVIFLAWRWSGHQECPWHYQPELRCAAVNGVKRFCFPLASVK